MSHRAKHLRRNWIPERLAKAKEREKADIARQAQAAVDAMNKQVGVVK